MAVLAVLALLGALAGCGSDEASDPDGRPTPTETRTLEIADTYEMPGNPEWLLEEFGHVWALKDDGHVVEFDPASGDQVQTLDTGYHSVPACQGIGHDDTVLWTCAGTDALARIDPSTGTRTRVPAAKRSDEGRLAFSGGLLWYLESGSNDLVGLDATASEAGRVPLGELCTELAYDDAVVFALCPTTEHVIRVDPTTRAVTGTLDVDNPRAGAVAAGVLFVGAGGGMLQVDTETLDVLHTYSDVGPGLLGAVDATADEVWVRAQDTFLTAIDPETHDVVATVAAPELTSSGDVLITDDWIWATSSDDNTVVRVAR
jgi:outer membrane protein assembly factor BamB